MARDGKTTYRALPPPKQQQMFPSRRRSVKPKTTAAALPRLQKDQSTLTQLEWAGTPNASREIIDISSDVDDEDFQDAPRPKKRRRKSRFDERERGQNTLTQMVDSSGGMRRQNFRIDQDGFQIWEDSDEEQRMQENRKRQESRRRRVPWLRQGRDEDDGIEEEGEMAVEIPETSQLQPTSSPARVDSGVEAENGQAKRPSKPQTPRRVHFTEVPSSQTPPSTKFSPQASAQGMDTQQRSPLKERSTNLQPAVPHRWGPESQNISMKMLERIRLGLQRKVPLKDVTDVASPPKTHDVDLFDEHDAGVENATTIAPDSPTAHKPNQVTTVRDSQIEDLETLNPGTVIQSGSKPARSLKRVATVQDSQFDEEDLLSDNDHIGHIEDHEYQYTDDDYEPQNTYSYNYTQATFDPANSALDRDASRFGCWTQTQQKPSSDIDEDSETDDEDLDRGCAPNAVKMSAGAVPLSSERSQEQGETDDHTLSRNDQLAAKEGVSNGDAIPAPSPTQLPNHNSLDQPAPNERDREEDTLPSSPPQPPPSSQSLPKALPSSSSAPQLPSQPNTVVQTQQSIPSQEPEDEASTIATTSPQKSYPASAWPPISSSPLPLPPWSSQAAAAKKDEGLVDWSLPPPPSLPSSSGQPGARGGA